MKKVILLITLLTLVIVSCNREESHIVVTENSGQPQGGAIVVFNTDSVANQKFEDIHLYAFDAEEKMVVHQYYLTPKEQAKDMLQIEGGTYTFVAVVNVSKDFSPTTTSATENLPDITLTQLLDALKQAANDYPDMLTGKANNTIINHQVVRMQIPLSNKIGESKPDIDPDIDIAPDTNEWEEGESVNGDISNPNN